MNSSCKQLAAALTVGFLAAGCATVQVGKQPTEQALVEGLRLVKTGHYERALPALQAGLKWLRLSPSFTQTSDALVTKEAEYVTTLIDQIASAKRKGVLGSSQPMARIITTAIEAQAKVIESIDKRRRDQWRTANQVP